MSEKAFKEAKGQLAYSQSLVDRIKQEKMAQPSPYMGEEEMTPQDMPQEEAGEVEEEVDEKKGIVEAVKEAVQPMFDKVMGAFAAKDEPKEVELKIDGEMKPKDGTTDN